MNQKLRLFMMTLLCAVFSVAWGESSVDISPSQALNDGGVTPITIVCAKGDGTSAPAISSGQLRLYQASSGKTTGNTITFSSLNTITKIEFTFANSMTADNGVFSEGSYDSGTSTWTGSTNSVTLTVTGTKSGERIYITAMKVYYEGNNNPSINVGDVSVIGNAAVELDVNVSNYTGTITFTSNPANAVTVTEANGVYSLTATASAVVTATLGSTGVSTTFKVTYFSSGKSFPWSEDFSSNSLDGYTVVNGESDTKLYPNENLAGGEKPELLIGKKGGSFTVPINLNGNYGDFMLTFKANAKRVTLDVDGGESSTLEFDTNTNIYTTTITVEEGTQILVLTFSNGYSDNVRVDDFLLEKKKITPSLSFVQTSFNVAPGATFDAPQLDNIDDVSPVTYSSSDESLATVNPETGAVTIRNNEGTVTITASFAGNDTYYAASASYTIVIGTPHGTEENPYTVAEARAAIDANTGTQGVYATGIVSNIFQELNNGYISYDISVNGTTTAEQLRAYKGKSYNGNDFTSSDDIKVGDNVIIYGNLIKYNNIYEFAQDNQLVSLVRPIAPPVITVTSSNVDLAFDATAGEIEYSIENPVDGKSLTVTTEADWISNISVGTDKVTFETTANEGEERTATITLAYEGAEDVTVTVTQEAYVAPGTTTTYVKVTKTEDITDGNYLIVYEEESVAFDGSLETLDAAFNNQSVTIYDSKIETDKAIYFTIDVTKGTIKSASGYYIGITSYGNGLKYNKETTYANNINFDKDGNVIISKSFDSGTMTLKYNNNKNDKRFRYYKATTNSEPIQLYKEVKEQPIEEDTPFTLTISSNAYDKTGTYYATMGAIGNGNFKVPQGIEVSSIIVNESKKIVPTQTYTFEEGDILDGKEAYLIEAKSANSYTFTPTTEGVTKPIGLNMLYPATAGEQISAPDGGTNDEYKFYQLSRNSNKDLGSVGFYYGPNCTLGQPFSFTNPNKAYLAVPASIATGASIGLFDGIDGIADAIVNEGAQRSVYTLTGVRVDSKQLPKGIYIIDGKKQVVK